MPFLEKPLCTGNWSPAHKNIHWKAWSNKLMILGSDRKKQWSLAEKGHVWKEWGVMTQGKEVEEGTLLLGSDKNNAIASQV